MKARLRRVCKNCTDSSLQTYYYNIKALAKMAGHDEVPNNHRWINSALLKKIRKSLPLMKFKNMTISLYITFTNLSTTKNTMSYGH